MPVSAAGKAITRALRIAGAGLALLTMAYLLAAFLGSRLPRNMDWRPAATGVDIQVESNGIHTALILPKQAAGHDWGNMFSESHLPANAPRGYTHVAISWGQRDFFLGTATWADLKLSTVAKAATGGEALLHVYHYRRPAPTPHSYPVRISVAEYRRLVASLESSMIAGAKPIKGYGPQDVFYPARGHYSLIRTCNVWTADHLAKAGIRVGEWTPMPGGVMRWFRP